MNLIFGLVFSILLAILLAYIKNLNIAFGTRDVQIYQFGFAVFPFALYQILFDEIRKFLINKFKAKPTESYESFYERYLMW